MALFGTLNGILGAGGGAPSRWMACADGIQIITTDFGVTWSSDLNFNNGQSGVHGMPSGTWLLFTNNAPRGIYQSTDNADSFTLKNNFNNVDARGASADANKNWVVVGIASLIKYSSDDGATWSTANNPFTGSSIVRIQAVTNNGSGDYICTGHGYNPGSGSRTPIAVSNDSGVTWTKQDIIGGDDMQCISTDGSIWIIAGSFGTMYRSTDTGSTWTEITTPFDNTIQSIANFGGTWIIVGNDSSLPTQLGISRSTDGGLTWSSFISNPLEPGDPRVKYDALGQLMIANKQGASKGTSTSTDDGLTWSSVVAYGINGSIGVGLSVFSNNSGNT